MIVRAAVNLSEVPSQPPDRRHQLKGNKKELFAVDLWHPYRLIFKPVEPIELLKDGGIDLTKVSDIIIIGVEDYHGD